MDDIRTIPDRRLYLDGVRGLAALIVLTGHCSNAGIHLIPGIDATMTAKAGVWLFFVLSAYLLTGSLQDRPLSSSLKLYAVRRIFRIMPLYLTILAVMTATGWLTVSEAVMHALLLDGTAHLWTIPAEMAFYLFLPLLLLPTTWFRSGWVRSGYLAALAATSLVVYAVKDPSGITANTPDWLNYLPLFVGGIVAAFIPIRVARHWWFGWPLIVLCLCAWLALLPPNITAFGVAETEGWEWSWLYAFVWPTFLLGLERSASAQKVFAAAPLAFIGRVSFGVYLIHVLLIAWLAPSAALPQSIKGAVVLALSMLLATIAYVLIERPALRLGTRLAEPQSIPRRPRAVGDRNVA